APLLDHQLVEWAAGLPAGCKLAHGQGKYILKRALEPYVPSSLLYRPKQGFSIPLAAWLCGPLRRSAESALASEVLAGSGLLDVGLLRRPFTEHHARHRPPATLLRSGLS